MRYCPACTFYGSNPRDCICTRLARESRSRVHIDASHAAQWHASEAERSKRAPLVDLIVRARFGQ